MTSIRIAAASIRIAAASMLAAVALAGGAVSVQHAPASHVSVARAVLKDGVISCCVE